MEEKELQINLRFCNFDDESFPGKVVFNKDSNMMRATYHHYVFDADEFKKVFPEGKASSDATVKIIVETTSESKYFPKEGAVPLGGFSDLYHLCKFIQ
jgi:hypothetical protein